MRRSEASGLDARFLRCQSPDLAILALYPTDSGPDRRIGPFGCARSRCAMGEACLFVGASRGSQPAVSRASWEA